MPGTWPPCLRWEGGGVRDRNGGCERGVRRPPFRVQEQKRRDRGIGETQIPIPDTGRTGHEGWRRPRVARGPRFPGSSVPNDPRGCNLRSERVAGLTIGPQGGRAETENFRVASEAVAERKVDGACSQRAA